MSIPLEKDNPKGLHRRYIVTKASGEQIDENAEYFVLRLDYGGKDEKHIKACRVAINAYAMAIEDHLPFLASDIKTRYGHESKDLAPFSLLSYVKDYDDLIKKILPDFEKNLSFRSGNTASERISHVLSQFRSIADSAIYQAKNFIDDVKTQFKAIEIIVEGISREDLNHTQKRVIANHVITVLRNMVDRIDHINWEYTDRIFDRYNFFRSNTPERNLMERYKDLKAQCERLKEQLGQSISKTVKDAVDELPF